MEALVRLDRGLVEREERKEAFLSEAYEALRNYNLTGLHVTHKEATAWMAKLENGELVEPPRDFNRSYA